MIRNALELGATSATNINSNVASPVDPVPLRHKGQTQTPAASGVNGTAAYMETLAGPLGAVFLCGPWLPDRNGGIPANLVTLYSVWRQLRLADVSLL